MGILLTRNAWSRHLRRKLANADVLYQDGGSQGEVELDPTPIDVGLGEKFVCNLCAH